MACPAAQLLRVPRLSISQAYSTIVSQAEATVKIGYGDYANYETQYSRWTPNDFSTGGGPRLEASNQISSVVVMQFGMTTLTSMKQDLHSFDIFTFFRVCNQLQDTWGSNRAAKTYAERIQPTGYLCTTFKSRKTMKIATSFTN